MKADDPLWRLLKGAAKRRRTRTLHSQSTGLLVIQSFQLYNWRKSLQLSSSSMEPAPTLCSLLPSACSIDICRGFSFCKVLTLCIKWLEMRTIYIKANNIQGNSEKIYKKTLLLRKSLIYKQMQAFEYIYQSHHTLVLSVLHRKWIKVRTFSCVTTVGWMFKSRKSHKIALCTCMLWLRMWGNCRYLNYFTNTIQEQV